MTNSIEIKCETSMTPFYVYSNQRGIYIERSNRHLIILPGHLLAVAGVSRIL